MPDSCWPLLLKPGNGYFQIGAACIQSMLLFRIGFFKFQDKDAYVRIIFYVSIQTCPTDKIHLNVCFSGHIRGSFLDTDGDRHGR